MYQLNSSTKEEMKTLYLFTFCVSSWVLNEFISSSGTLHPYLEFKDCKQQEGSSTEIEQRKEMNKKHRSVNC